MIRENREKAGYSQEKLAELIDISPRQMQRIEADEQKTKISTLKRIIQVLPITDEEIINYIRKK